MIGAAQIRAARALLGVGQIELSELAGVGLSTVKMAAEAHRGHTWVTSDAEEGTTFFLSLPQDGRRPD